MRIAYHRAKESRKWKSGLIRWTLAPAHLLVLYSLSAAEPPPPTSIPPRAPSSGLSGTTTQLPGKPRFGEAVEEDALRFYRTRNNRPAWTEPASVHALTDLVFRLDQWGLPPHRYTPELVLVWGQKALLGDFEADVELTRTALVMARHLGTGVLEPSMLSEYAWEQEQLWIDPVRALERGLIQGQPAEAITSLAPDSPRHTMLLAQMTRYRGIVEAGGWPKVPPGKTIKKKNRPDSLRVALLESRLAAEGYLADRQIGVLDTTLMAGVSEYQRRQGLDVDGLAGKSTIEALNVPAQSRLDQIKANLERVRWAHYDRPAKRVEVNIPDCRLAMFENHEPIGSMRTAVGKPDWPTPSFNDQIRYIVLNPYWHVPKTVAVKTVLRKINSDSSYFASQEFEVLHGDSVVTPDVVDWTSVTEDNFAYRLRQKPGPRNALGRMKFMFPNRFAIYLHDTPSISTFRKANRAVSHGCIRVHRPHVLAEFLFSPDSAKSGQLPKLLKAQEQKYINLPTAVPVFLDYNTVFADSAGTLHFRKDIYGVDQEMARLLNNQELVEGTR